MKQDLFFALLLLQLPLPLSVETFGFWHNNYTNMAPKKLKLIDEEAACSGDDSSDDSSDDGSDLGSFLVSDGELSDSHYITKEASSKKFSIPNVTPKKRGRPPGKVTVKSKTEAFKPPGDSSYPSNDFSLTITKTGSDVGVDAVDKIAHFIEKYCVKGGVATEVGQRAFNLHLQGMFRINWPSRKEYIQELQKIIKRILPDDGKKYKVNLKPFGAGQSFSAMVGYITKDQGNSNLNLYIFFSFDHYRYRYFLIFNIQVNLTIKFVRITFLAKSYRLVAETMMLC